VPNNNKNEPLVSQAQMAHTLRDVAPRCAPVLAAAFLDIAATLKRGETVTNSALHTVGAMGQVIDLLQRRMEREPGEEG